MSYDWKKIKEEIRKETQDVFSLQPTFSIDEALELFRKILEFPTNRPELKLDGLPDLLEAMERILIHNQISGDNFNAMALPFEAYLKKLLYLVNQPFYLANAHNITLGDKFDKNKVLIANGLIRELQLNPGKYQYWQRNMPVVKQIFDEHLWRAYNLRNSLAHFCTTYNRQQFWQGVQSYLVMYLYAAHKHKAAILQAVEPYFLSAYLQQYIADYQQWQTLFVPIAGIEFEKIEIWASEVPEEERPKQGQDNPEDDKKKPKPYRSSRQMRGGTVNELRRTIQERQMIVIAEPGMGKSTSLQYIAYTDAQAIEAGDTNMPYPVYLELKLFQQGDVVKQRIIQKLGIDAGVGEKLLAEGKITLLLDGLNEVAESNRNETIQAVKRFMEDYPDVFVLLTTRPNAYERYWFDNIRSRNKAPIFQLQQMELPQIEEFLQKNSAQEAADIILHAIEANEALKNIIKTPLLLKMLIALVSQQPQAAIPPTETDIILGFISGICNWEKEQNASYNPNIFLERLTYFAHQARMRNEANTAIAEDEILQILQPKAPEWELKNLLQKATELRLLAYDKTENRYSFIHEVYQEALWAKQQAQFDKYPPATNSGIQYVPAIELWHKTRFKEALRLYSALLTGQNRFDFVREIGKRNVLLAARCKTACWHPEPELKQMIVERAKLFAVFYRDAWPLSLQGFDALLSLDANDEIRALLAENEIVNWGFSENAIGLLSTSNLIKFIKFLAEYDLRTISYLVLLSIKYEAIKYKKEFLKELEELAEELFEKGFYNEYLIIDALLPKKLKDSETIFKLLSESDLEYYKYSEVINGRLKLYDIFAERKNVFYERMLKLLFKYNLQDTDFADRLLENYISNTAGDDSDCMNFLVNNAQEYKIKYSHAILGLFRFNYFASLGSWLLLYPYRILTEAQIKEIRLWSSSYINLQILLTVAFEIQHENTVIEFVKKVLKDRWIEDNYLLEVYLIIKYDLQDEFPVREIDLTVKDEYGRNEILTFVEHFYYCNLEYSAFPSTSIEKVIDYFLDNAINVSWALKLISSCRLHNKYTQSNVKMKLMNKLQDEKVVVEMLKNNYVNPVATSTAPEKVKEEADLYSQFAGIDNNEDLLSFIKSIYYYCSKKSVAKQEILQNIDAISKRYAIKMIFRVDLQNEFPPKEIIEKFSTHNIDYQIGLISYFNLEAQFDLNDIISKVLVMEESDKSKSSISTDICLIINKWVKGYHISEEIKNRLVEHILLTNFESRNDDIFPSPEVYAVELFCTITKSWNSDFKNNIVIKLFDDLFPANLNSFPADLLKKIIDEFGLQDAYKAQLIEKPLSTDNLKSDIGDLDEGYRDKLKEILGGRDISLGEFKFDKAVIDKYGLDETYKVVLIETVLKKGSSLRKKKENMEQAKKIVDEYQLNYLFPVEKFIDRAKDLIEEAIFNYKSDPNSTIQSGCLYNDVAIAQNLIDEYHITDRFLIVSLFWEAIHSDYSKFTDYILTNKYNIIDMEETPPTILQAIEKGYIKTVKKWADAINLHDFCPPKDMVTKAIEMNETETAQYWVQKYNLYSEFPQFEPPGEAAEEDTLPPEEA